LKPDSGKISTTGKTSIGYLPQDIDLPTGQTVWEAASIMPPKLRDVETALNEVEAQMGDPAVYNDERKLTAVMAKQERLLDNYERLGMANFDSRVQRVLGQLGFGEADYATPVDVLSGGEKKLIALATLALEAPDVLLLDEPDNHLDIDAKHNLESFIHGYNGAVILISHDRYLLDEVVSEIAELADGKLTLWKGNYTRFTTEKELARIRQEQLYVAQQKRVQQIEAAIARFEHWAKITEDVKHIRKARSKRKMLERMEANGEMVEKITQRRLMDLNQLDGGRGSTQAVKLEGVTVVLGDEPIVMDVDLLVQHGERVGLVGGNGAGKSVLFKTVLGEIEPFEGTVTVGNSTKVGYYAQEHQTLTDFLNRTPIELLQYIKGMYEDEAVARLLKFAFSYDQARQQISTMSGGERSRLQLLKLMLEKPNLLMLDEPTNNLDIQSVEVLEDTLESFEGAVFVISHDRYFLDNVVDRVIELRDGSATGYLGGYTDYLEQRR
jgi:ATP-binding cassette subfamily F protein 3